MNGRCQGVCLGGGGGGDFDTVFPSKNPHNGVGVLSSSPIAEKKKKIMGGY